MHHPPSVAGYVLGWQYYRQAGQHKVHHPTTAMWCVLGWQSPGQAGQHKVHHPPTEAVYVAWQCRKQTRARQSAAREAPEVLKRRLCLLGLSYPAEARGRWVGQLQTAARWVPKFLKQGSVAY